MSSHAQTCHLCTCAHLLPLFSDLSCAFDHTSNAFALAQVVPKNRVALDSVSVCVSVFGEGGGGRGRERESLGHPLNSLPPSPSPLHTLPPFTLPLPPPPLTTPTDTPPPKRSHPLGHPSGPLPLPSSPLTWTPGHSNSPLTSLTISPHFSQSPQSTLRAPGQTPPTSQMFWAFLGVRDVPDAPDTGLLTEEQEMVALLQKKDEEEWKKYKVNWPKLAVLVKLSHQAGGHQSHEQSWSSYRRDRNTPAWQASHWPSSGFILSNLAVEQLGLVIELVIRSVMRATSSVFFCFR